MEWDKGQLAEFADGRSVRVCASKDGGKFLLEFMTPLVGEVAPDAEIERHRAAKVQLTGDGKVTTTFTLAPEAFYTLLGMSAELTRRIMEDDDPTVSAGGVRRSATTAISTEDAAGAAKE